MIETKFLITYDDSGVYNFFSEDKAAYSIALSTFGVSIFGTKQIPEITEEIENDFYVREVTNTNLITQVLEMEVDNVSSILLDLDDYVFSCDNKSFVLLNEEVISTIFSVESGQVTVSWNEEITGVIRIQLYYYKSYPNGLEKDQLYNLSLIKNSIEEEEEFRCKYENDTFYIGDYNYFMYGDDNPESEEIIVETIPTQINDYISIEQNQYKITFNGVEYILYTKELIESEETPPIAYVGNLYLYDNTKENTGEPFLIITRNLNEESEESELFYKTWLYVETTGEYELLVESYNLILIPELTGAALVSFGRKVEEDGTFKLEDNYGIGINSGDNKLTLPEKAISLFETELNTPTLTDKSKIKLNYRGILGTLPQLRYVHQGEINPQVAKLYEDYMKGTQGIYTDNMYIGDATQYLAFYTKNGQKRLDVTGGIHALSLTIGEGNNAYNGIAAIEAAGYSLDIVIVEDNTLIDSVYLYPHLYYNGDDITDDIVDYTQFLWYENDSITPIRGQGGTGKGRIIASKNNRYRVVYSIEY